MTHKHSLSKDDKVWITVTLVVVVGFLLYCYWESVRP